MLGVVPDIGWSMPELPEVEAVRRALQPAMEGARFEKVIANRPDLRAALPSRFAARLRGQTVLSLDRRGKYLVAELSSRQTLLMHLGMSGSFRIDRRRTAALPHDHVVFHMSSGATVTFNLVNDGAATHNMHIAGESGDYDQAFCDQTGEDPCCGDRSGLCRSCLRAGA